jgi:hypothetical protein
MHPFQHAPQIQQPQHIAEILSHVLELHGLVPADVWQDESASPALPLQADPAPLAFSGISFPVPIS